MSDLVLNSLYINPTKFCNLSCRHCWISPPHNDKVGEEAGEISAKEMIGIIKAGRELGLSSVKFTGGEPLLRNDLKEVFEFCSDSGISVFVETNGTLITENWAELFQRCKVSLVSVSLDSHVDEKHDFYRGHQGSFDRTVSGIKTLMKKGISPQVIISLYRENIRDFDRFLVFMKELGVRNIKINTISPVGRGTNLIEAGDAPSVKEVLDFSKDLLDIKGSFEGFIYLDVPMAFKDIGEMKHGGCGLCAIKNILGILSDGTVSICGIGYLDENLIFGNARKDPACLKDIWSNNGMLKEIREKVPSMLEGVCGMCVFKKRCLGSCRAEVYHNTASLMAPHWFCQQAYEQGLFPSTRLIPEELRART
jgi:SynChlorMet cassette radical SAM/SPASM protein ScmF